MKHTLFTVTVKAFLRDDDKVLLLKSIDGKYDLPGGRIDEGEESLPLKAILRRELGEELGDNVKIEIEKLFDVWLYKHEKFGHRFSVGFLCKFLGGKIKLDGKEYAEYVWVNRQELDTLPISERFKLGVARMLPE